MPVVAVVQARLSSSRLPGKILRPLAGQPMLGHLCDGLARACTLDGIIIATSSESSDDVVENYARERDMPIFRGSLSNVAKRLLEAARWSHADVLVRINGDSPLLDPVLVDQAVSLFVANSVDIVTNVQPRSFPKGQSVEVIATASLAEAVVHMTTEYEREHVTPYFYTHSDRCMIRSFEAAQPRPEVQLSVDTAADFARCEEIMKMLGRPHWEAGWEACVKAYDELLALESGIADD
jgi:spore coat polysaccharide biosynthesis protein SpsF